MFNEKSYSSLTGRSGNSTKSSNPQMSCKRNKEGHWVVNNADPEFIMAIAKVAMKFGVLLGHQSKLEKQSKNIIVGLHKKNFPEDCPEQWTNEKLRESFSLIDKESGLPFGRILHDQMIDDWANDPSASTAVRMVNEIEQMPPEHSFEFLQATVSQMRDAFNKATRLEMESQRIN